MGRLGYLCDESHYEESLERILETLKLPGLDWEGVFTHFCVADEPENPVSREFTKLQYDRFTRMVLQFQMEKMRMAASSSSGGAKDFIWTPPSAGS